MRQAVPVGLDLGHSQSLACDAAWLRVAEHVGEGGGALRTADIHIIVDGGVLDGGEAACGVLRVVGIVRVGVVGIGAQQGAANADREQAFVAVVGECEHLALGVGLGVERVVGVVGVADRAVLRVC